MSTIFQRSGLFWGLLFAATPAHAQCDFDKLMREGRAFLRQEKPAYREALNKFSAARICASSRSEEVENEINQIFDAIEAQKNQERQNRLRAEQSRRASEEALRETEQQIQTAKAAREAHKKAFHETLQKRRIAVAEQQKADSLAKRGALLLETLTQKSDEMESFTAFMDLGWQFWAYDSVALGRNYAQAAVYFSLANFLGIGGDRVGILVECAQNGQKADQLFYHGEIEKARDLYLQIRTYLNSYGRDASYEDKQIGRIAEIIDLFRTQGATRGRVRDTLVLDGNWWTLPTRLLEYKKPRVIVLRNNGALTDGLPGSLLQQDGIEALHIENCPRLSEIKNWGTLRSSLRSLTLRENPALKTLDLPGGMSALQELRVMANPDLVRIHTAETLPAILEVLVKDNPLLSETNVWAHSPTMTSLGVIGNPLLSSRNFSLQSMPKLEYLLLSELSDLKTLRGAGRSEHLAYLGLFNNPQLRRIRSFSHLLALRDVHIAGNPKLKTIGSLRNLPALRSIEVVNNSRLRSLPNWKRSDDLQEVQINHNPRLYRLGNWQALKDVPVKKLQESTFVRKYVALRGGVLTDGQSDNFFDLGFFTGFSYYQESDQRFWSITPSVDYIWFNGSQTSDVNLYLPYFRAAKNIINPITGGITESVRYFDGYSRYKLQYLDFKMLLKLTHHEYPWGVYLNLGPTLLWRLPSSEVAAYIEGSGTVFTQKTESRALPYLFTGFGISYTYKRTLFAIEFNIQAPFGGATVKKNTVRQTFYSEKAIKFETTPLEHAFEIQYEQPTFDFYVVPALSVAYQLNYFNPHTK